MKLRLSVAPLLAALAIVCATAQATPRRLVAIADIHGDALAFRGILQTAGLTDTAGAWTGGTSILVQTGDYLDRGAAARQVLDLLRGLEDSAKRAGGEVDVLLGNHEAMNLIAEYRDVNPAVYQSFADEGSEKRRERAFEDYRKLAERRREELPKAAAVYSQDRTAWFAAHPPGFLEYAEALSRRGSYGRWLRERPVAIKIEGSILMHAGLKPEGAPASLDALNQSVRDEIRRFDEARDYLVARGLTLPFFTLSETLAAASAEAEALLAGKRQAPDKLHIEALDTILNIGRSPLAAAEGPLWFRGFDTWTEEEGRTAISSLLQRYGAERFVTGHSVQNGGTISNRFDNRLFLIDTGMLAAAYKGRASALEVVGKRVTAIYHGSSVVLDEGGRQRPAAAGVDR